MFSQTVEYALRVAVALAVAEPEARTTDQLAVATRVPRAYLAKVIQALVRGGVATSKRGVGGGVLLSKPSARMSVLEIVNSVEPIGRITTCPLGLAAHGVKLCPLHRRLDDALAHVENAFASTTLAEILDEPSTSIPLCPFPQLKPKTSRRTAEPAE